MIATPDVFVLVDYNDTKTYFLFCFSISKSFSILFILSKLLASVIWSRVGWPSLRPSFQELRKLLPDFSFEWLCPAMLLQYKTYSQKSEIHWEKDKCIETNTQIRIDRRVRTQLCQFHARMPRRDLTPSICDHAANVLQGFIQQFNP